jgi:hypothetical protein
VFFARFDGVLHRVFAANGDDSLGPSCVKEA